MRAKLNIVGEQNLDKTVVEIKRIFNEIDEKFSTYKPDSLISKYNRKEIGSSGELNFILGECERTRKETSGYFDCEYGGRCDPTGLVKGYALSQAAKCLREAGYINFLVEISGDVQTAGLNEEGEPWAVGIQNPFNLKEIVKVVKLSGQGIATSGNAIHPGHIVNPFTHQSATEIASMSVIADDVYDCDRMATAAFAMGSKGIEFVNKQSGYSGYMITKDKVGIMSEGFKQYVK
jgi:thiamine biosynthesis lipoprotein